MAFYGNKFRSILDSLYSAKNQTKTGKRLGIKFTLTCNPNFIESIHKNNQYVRSAISRRMTEQYGAVGSLISQNEERAKIKREVIKKYLNNHVYKKSLKSILDNLLDFFPSEKDNQIDLFPWLRRSLTVGIMKDFFGVELSQELRKELIIIGSELLKHEESLEKVAILNFFNFPLWLRNLFSSSLRKRNHIFQKITELIYNKATVLPGGLFYKFKEMEEKKILSRKEVLGEIRSIHIGCSTLATSLVWAIYRLSIENKQHINNLISSDSYARYCYLECLRLYPPFPIISYEKKNKCPFHFNETIVVSTYLTHRNPLYWEKPDVFNPTRFKSGMINNKRGSFFPFGGGERYCPGTAMSMVIGPKILQSIFKKFNISNVTIASQNSLSTGSAFHPVAIGRIPNNNSSIIDSQRDKKIIEENLTFFAKVSPVKAY